MTSKKTKNTTKHLIQEVCEDRESSGLRSEIDDLRYGLERRKFTYTIHIPERRSGQARVNSRQSFFNLHSDKN